MLGMVAEMERKFIRERQQAGMEAAKARGSIMQLPGCCTRCLAR